MGRRVERRARRRGLQLTHPAEGIALSVAGALVIATLWSGYQNFEDPPTVTINPTASSQPTSMESVSRQDEAASYPSALLRPAPEASTVGQGVRVLRPEPQPVESAESTATEPPTTASPEPTPESPTATEPPTTTGTPTDTPSKSPTTTATPTDTPTDTPTTPTPPSTPTTPTSPAAPPTTTPPPEPPDSTPGPVASSTSGAAPTTSPVVPGGATTTTPQTAKNPGVGEQD